MNSEDLAAPDVPWPFATLACCGPRPRLRRRLHAGENREDRLHAQAADRLSLSPCRRAVLREDRRSGRLSRCLSSRPKTMPATQVAQAENVITQGVDAIVIQPVDFNVAASIAEMANEAGIPIASYDDLILGAKQTAFIGRDPKEGGAEAAKAVVATVPKGNFVLIGGDPGQTGSTQMQEGYHVVVDPLVAKGDIKIVLDQFSPGWKTEPAQAHAENALTQNNNSINAFLVSYDGMSLGVLQAIEVRELDGRIHSCHRAGHGAVRGAGDRRRHGCSAAYGRRRTRWPCGREGGDRHGEMRGHWRHGQDQQQGAADIPWVKTPIYLVSQKEMPEFVCKHQYWLDINEVYKNVPDKMPAC